MFDKPKQFQMAKLVNSHLAKGPSINNVSSAQYIMLRQDLNKKWKAKNKKFQKFSDRSKFFFCFTIHKKLNKSCFLEKLFLFLKKKIVSLKKTSFEILWSEVWKGGFQLMLILGLLGMYFDAVVAEVKTCLLLFRFALAILWLFILFFSNFFEGQTC